MKDRENIEFAIRALNELLAGDSKAVHDHFTFEVPVVRGIWDHDTIQLCQSHTGDGTIVMRTLGLINGLFEACEHGWGAITMMWDEDEPWKITGFHRTLCSEHS